MSASTAAPQLEIALAYEPSLIVNALGPPPQFMIENKRNRKKVGFSWKGPTRTTTRKCWC